jgi:two-component system NtrC family sensor kinase
VGKGTGLGLSICQGIIAEHGGRLTATSRPGDGAQFTVELPIIVPVVDPIERRIPLPFVATRKSVLVIDDEGHLRELFQEILAREGHQIQTASSGKEALELIHRNPHFDLIITDIKMPEIDGMELHRILKAEGSGFSDRLLFVTGDLMNPDTLRFLENCGNPWIAKPFVLSSVTEVVNKALFGERQ